MKFEPFELERWLPSVTAEVNLAGALVVPLNYSDVMSRLDLDQPITYGSTRGSSLLREEVSSLYLKTSVGPENVLITNGTAEANFLVLSSLLEPGDEFILVTPTYLQSLGLARAMGATTRTVGLHEDKGWSLDLSELEAVISPRTKAIQITNPNNPTGTCFDEETIASVCRIAEHFGSYVICDEALRGLEATEIAVPSPAELYDRGISTGSLSKLGLPGLRLGWVVGPEEVVEGCWTHKDYTTLAHGGLSEALAEMALNPLTYQRIRARGRRLVREHSQILVEWAERNNRILSCVVPVAGGSAFPAYSIDLDSVSFCRRALEEVSVALSPGDFFGSPRHFRIRYGAPKDTLQAGLDRLDRFFAGL